MTLTYRYVALASDVLAVAVINNDPKNNNFFDWTAYIKAVPGINHQLEYMNVAKHGDKLQSELAFIIFPNFLKERWRA